MLWHLHFPLPALVPHIPRPGPGPINYPPVINELLLALVTYSSSFQLADREAALKTREAAKQQVVEAANRLEVEERR
jgi:hypothetical protein